MAKPMIATGGSKIAAAGGSFEIYEWSGSGPEYLHVHYSDDEAWYVLEGSLSFKFEDHQIEAPAGTTVFVPAGVAHSYSELIAPARYLIILTPRLRQLIEQLHKTPLSEHQQIMQQFDSAILQ